MSTKSPAEAKEALGEFTGIPIMRWMFLLPRIQMELKAAQESEDVSREIPAPPSSREQDAGCPPDTSMVEAFTKALSRESEKDKSRYFRASVVKEFGVHRAPACLIKEEHVTDFNQWRLFSGAIMDWLASNRPKLLEPARKVLANDRDS